jgi:hypothetical protein
MLRRHREYSEFVACAWSSETPGRRGEVFGDIVLVLAKRGSHDENGRNDLGGKVT